MGIMGTMEGSMQKGMREAGLEGEESAAQPDTEKYPNFPPGSLGAAIAELLREGEKRRQKVEAQKKETLSFTPSSDGVKESVPGVEDVIVSEATQLPPKSLSELIERLKKAESGGKKVFEEETIRLVERIAKVEQNIDVEGTQKNEIVPDDSVARIYALVNQIKDKDVRNDAKTFIDEALERNKKVVEVQKSKESAKRDEERGTGFLRRNTAQKKASGNIDSDTAVPHGGASPAPASVDPSTPEVENVVSAVHTSPEHIDENLTEEVSPSTTQEGAFTPSGEKIKESVDALFGKSVRILRTSGGYDNTWFLHKTFIDPNTKECKAFVMSYERDWIIKEVSGEKLLEWQQAAPEVQGGEAGERGFVAILRSYVDNDDVPGLKTFLESLGKIPDGEGHFVPSETLCVLLDEVPDMARLTSVPQEPNRPESHNHVEDAATWLSLFPETGGLRDAVRQLVMRHGKKVSTPSVTEPTNSEPDIESDPAEENLEVISEWKTAREEYRAFSKELNNARRDYLAKLEEYESLRREAGVFKWIFSQDKLKEGRAALEAEEKKYNELLDRVYTEREKRIHAYNDRFALKDASHEAEKYAATKRARVIRLHAAVLDKRVDEDVKLVEAVRFNRNTGGESNSRLVRLWQAYSKAKWYNKVLMGAAAVGVGGVTFSLATGASLVAAGGVGAGLIGRRIVGGSAGIGAAIGTKLVGDRMAEKYGERKMGELKENAKGETWEKRSLADERDARLRVNQGVCIRKHVATTGAATAALVAGAGASNAYAAIESASLVADVPSEVPPPVDTVQARSPEGFTTAKDAYTQELREVADNAYNQAVKLFSGDAANPESPEVSGDVAQPKAPTSAPELAQKVGPGIEKAGASPVPLPDSALDSSPVAKPALMTNSGDVSVDALETGVSPDEPGSADNALGVEQRTETETPASSVEKPAPLTPREYMKALTPEHFNDVQVEHFEVKGTYEKGASVQGELIKHLRNEWYPDLTADEAGKVAFQLQQAMEYFQGDSALAQEFKDMFGVKKDWNVVPRDGVYTIDLPKDMVESFVARFRPDLVATDAPSLPSASGAVVPPEPALVPHPAEVGDSVRVIDQTTANDEILRAEQQNAFFNQTNDNTLAAARAESLMPTDQEWPESDVVVREEYVGEAGVPSKVIDQAPPVKSNVPTTQLTPEQRMSELEGIRNEMLDQKAHAQMDAIERALDEDEYVRAQAKVIDQASVKNEVPTTQLTPEQRAIELEGIRNEMLDQKAHAQMDAIERALDEDEYVRAQVAAEAATYPTEQVQVSQSEVPVVTAEGVRGASQIPESQTRLDALQQELLEARRQFEALEQRRMELETQLAALEAQSTGTPEISPTIGIDTVRLGAWPEEQIRSAVDSMQEATRTIEREIGNAWNTETYLPESTRGVWKEVLGSCDAFKDLHEVHRDAVLDAWKSLGYIDVAKLYDTTAGQTYDLPGPHTDLVHVGLSNETELFMRSVLTELEAQYGEPVKVLIEGAQKRTGVTMAGLFEDINKVIAAGPRRS